MKIDALILALDRIVLDIESGIDEAATIAGGDLAALVENRVVQTGKSADGQPFSPYSTTPVPAFFYFNKSRNAAGENRARSAAKAGLPLSYRDFRGANGLGTDEKNFEFTGEMWQGFGVVSLRKTANGASVTIGGKTPTSAQRIEWNSGREKKNIVAPSEQELAVVRANLVLWANKIVNKNL